MQPTPGIGLSPQLGRPARLRFLPVAAAWTFLALAGCATTAPRTAPLADANTVISVDVGGETTNLAPIDGWCILPKEDAKDLIKDAGPEVRVHAIFADCGELKAGVANKDLEQMGIVGTPIGLLTMDIGDDRAAFVAEAARQLGEFDLTDIFREAQDQALSEMDEEMAALKKAGMTLHVDDPVNLGEVAQDTAAVYYGVLQRVQVTGRGLSFERSIVTLFGVTEISRRTLLLCIQSQFEDGAPSHDRASIETTLTRARAQIARLIELNPDRGLAI